MVKKSSTKIDTLLEPLLLEASDEQADDLLLRLITVHAEPVIKGIIRYKLHLISHRADGRAEADDIYQDVLVQLLAELHQLRKQPDKHPITDVRGMAAIMVKAIKDGQEFKAPRPPAPQARFRILDQAKANELAKARRAYPSSHLTLGLLYAQAGLLKEAEQELRVLQKANPDSEIARSLLNQVLALRRRSE